MYLKVANWNIEALTGYHPITTLYSDFSIAEVYGPDSVKDTFRRCWDEYKDNVKVFTEFVMVLNWKIFEHYGHSEQYSMLYDKLWTKADLYACDHFKDADLDYYYSTTD